MSQEFDYTTGKWLSGKDDDNAGWWNAYGQESAPAKDEPQWGGVESAASGAGQYYNGAPDGTSGAISGAANGYQAGGTWGAVIGGIAGYFGGEKNEKERNKNSDLGLAKYEEEIRQKKRKEYQEALSKWDKPFNNPGYQFTNGALNGSGNMGGLFQSTQPLINPEQNSYGLMRG